MSVKNKNQNLTNLASPKIGTKIIEVSDDFFGEASRMLDDKEPVFIEDKYDEHGKWMDGWESKRRRDGGNDWAIIELGSPGIITKIDIDTSFFTGNFPPFASIEGLYSGQKPHKDSNWIEILSKTSLKGDSGNKFIASLAKECIELPDIMPFGSPHIFQTVFLFLLISSLSSISS